MSETPEHNTQAHTPQHEDTPEGTQTLVPGVAPVSLRERLEVLARKPMTPKRGPSCKSPAISAWEPVPGLAFGQTRGMRPRALNST